MKSRRSSPEVASITSAPVAQSDDLGRRQSRYLVTMAVRTACIVAAVFTDGALRWAAIAGAVVLPYVAVIAANVTSGLGRGPEAFGPSARGPAGAVPLAGPSASLPPGVAERIWPSRFSDAAPPRAAARPAVEGVVVRGPGPAGAPSDRVGPPPNA